MSQFVSFTIMLLSCSAVRSTHLSANSNQGNRSLAFVFDTTASMKVDYEQFKTNVQHTMEYVWQRNDTDVKHFIFVPFNDPDVGEVLETVNPVNNSNDINDLLHKQINISGGGDCPEKSMTAVIKALEVVNLNSYVLLFTDASPKDSDSINKALNLIQRKKLQVIVLNTGENCLSLDKSYEKITSLGSGNVFDICKNDISNILKFIKTSIYIKCRVNLISVNNPQVQTIPYPIKLSVDKSITDLMIIVSGLNSKVDIINPRGKINDNISEKLTADLDLNNVKIVSIKDPTAGEWTLNVTSESPPSIRACGISYIQNCNFGFATKEPKTMAQTSHRPLAGSKNYVLVDCPDAKHFSCCNILDLNSNSSKNLPLIKTEKNLLLCGPFKPNNNLFYVQICSTTSNGNYFKRISTSIIATKQDMLHVTSPKHVVAAIGSELRINCHIESLVPFTATWKLQTSDVPVKISNFSQSSDFELLIPSNVTEINFVNYTCIAQAGTSGSGKSESTTTVTRKTNHIIPYFKSTNDNLEVYEGGDLLMECKEYKTPVPRIEWLMNYAEIIPDNEHVLSINAYKKVIYDATLNNSNVYTCRASNEDGVTENHFNVTVKVNTDNSMVANESLIGKLDSTIILPCRILNNVTQWFKDNKVMEDERGDVKRLKQTIAGFRISSLRESDTAVYKCISISNDSYTVDLQVEVEPYFITEDEPVPLTIPKMYPYSVVFDCMAKGNPKLKVKWRKNNKPLTPWHFKDIEFLENKQQLKIHPANTPNWIVYNGTYSCMIKNKLGNETRNFELIVV